MAIIKPVALSSFITLAFPQITNALPSGAIAANNPVVEISFNTDTFSNCRYSTVAGVAYSSMTNFFPQTNAQLFYLTLSGFQNNTTYHYYIRCISTQGATNADDYDLTFSLAPTPVSDTSVPNPPGGGGGGGSGEFPNGSQVLYQASVTLSGFTAPGSTVQVLKDGVQVLAVQAQGTGAFRADVSNIPRGTASFTLYSIDNQQRKSAPYSSTLTVGSASTNNISGILLAPNISLESDSVAVGAAATILGSAPPNSLVEVLLTLKGGTGTPRTLTASSSATGAWSVTTKAGDLSTGTYVVKARTNFNSSQSDYSVPLYVGVGQAPAVTGGACGNPDINGDKKVNLVDFSILLSGWGTDAATTDLNCDGNTNLADFSILLFNWTG